MRRCMSTGTGALEVELLLPLIVPRISAIEPVASARANAARYSAPPVTSPTGAVERDARVGFLSSSASFAARCSRSISRSSSVYRASMRSNCSRSRVPKSARSLRLCMSVRSFLRSCIFSLRLFQTFAVVIGVGPSKRADGARG